MGDGFVWEVYFLTEQFNRNIFVDIIENKTALRV